MDEGLSARRLRLRSRVPAASNAPPVISGSPPTTVTVGQIYSFTPTATDPDGNPLTFVVANLPSWAHFNPANRQDRRHADRESRRRLRQRHDQRERRADERVARGVQDRRGPGREQQFAADDSGQPVDHGDHGPSLCFHADRGRRRRRFVDLHGRQSARMGQLQYVDRPDQRHADQRPTSGRTATSRFA